ncbi:MAG TPA: hypothetical protein VGQ41_04075 [Pyrinomonadaceae bacterium]|jgi:hypothetical protein|nr:hypothetical protein [Pyrinomonadaceae bacterium]
MNWMTIEGQTRVVGVLAVLFILYSLWLGQMEAPGLPAGYTNPVLALELAGNGSEIDAINRFEGGKAAEFIRRQVLKDFGYIGVYVGFFSCLALLFAELVSGGSKYLNLGAMGCAAMAGVFDVIENIGMLKAVSTPAGTATDSLANSIRYPSLAKWAFLFVFCLLVGLTLARLRGWLLIPGLAFLIAALLGLSGVTLNLLSPKSYWMFPASVRFLGFGIICVAITFTLWPQRVLSKFFAD